ncbi:hypothetical protein CROQUDRAFT_39077, partial [Cronartium quercuum f. sp. fusiforme G11]
SKFQFQVAMSCSGCSGAVERALKKQEGVTNVEISLENQTVIVLATEPATFEIIKERIAKTGKEIKSSEIVFTTSSESKP